MAKRKLAPITAAAQVLWLNEYAVKEAELSSMPAAAQSRAKYAAALARTRYLWYGTAEGADEIAQEAHAAAQRRHNAS